MSEGEKKLESERIIAENEAANNVNEVLDKSESKEEKVENVSVKENENEVLPEKEKKSEPKQIITEKEFSGDVSVKLVDDSPKGTEKSGVFAEKDEDGKSVLKVEDKKEKEIDNKKIVEKTFVPLGNIKSFYAAYEDGIELIKDNINNFFCFFGNDNKFARDRKKAEEKLKSVEEELAVSRRKKEELVKDIEEILFKKMNFKNEDTKFKENCKKFLRCKKVNTDGMTVEAVKEFEEFKKNCNDIFHSRAVNIGSITREEINKCSKKLRKIHRLQKKKK